jgi:hypothetical protein
MSSDNYWLFWSEVNLRPTVSQQVYLSVRLLSGAHDQIFFLSDNCGLLDAGHPLWQKDGSVIYLYNSFWSLPEQSLSGPNPTELMTQLQRSLCTNVAEELSHAAWTGLKSWVMRCTSLLGEVREPSEEASDWCTAIDNIDVGDQRAGHLVGPNNDIAPSSRQLFWQSTKRPKWQRKSAPMRGWETSTTTNCQVKSRCNPRSRLRGSHAYVVTDLLLMLWNELMGEHAEV